MNALARFPAVIFDYNGVLVDDEHVHLAAFREALQPLGLEVSERDYWERFLGFDDKGAFEAILREAGQLPSPERVQQLIDAKKPLYLARARRELKAFAGAGALVQASAAAGPVGIVSGALREEVHLGLELMGVRGCVQFIVAAEDTEASKPDPSGYRLGVRALEAPLGAALARQALVIEDSISGIEAAKAAGLACLAVAHSYASAELEGAGADLVVEQLGAIDADILASLYLRCHG